MISRGGIFVAIIIKSQKKIREAVWESIILRRDKIKWIQGK
ncbi:hypothetical protein Tthe_2615 [Thermoanaerobacterium thermosaccharolyticum DSM 571]|jgi:hypothetical protein|uniref:Uncharacterized protein n=1 Tax=Thermoanaerobacterium thermosaccharolyticum (strain ATCC 7956 / DSM 571 / NCIMB 9385 / NCA 3814 / NCTC 13789 / WDCM 00135 / 2032) TaxID=580327 RepID=D9TMA5_THETC|nr:hypothetical protein Tthe_2615 [Thermoanaerobacterium thermosaccharolyticum DSM 571]